MYPKTCIWWLRNLVLGLACKSWFIYRPSYKYSNTPTWNQSCLKDLFSAVNGYYNLHSQSDFRVPGINSFYGANSVRYFGSVIWNSLPNDLKNICDFDLFKTIGRWGPVGCPCRLCKNYLDDFGFIYVSS